MHIPDAFISAYDVDDTLAFKPIDGELFYAVHAPWGVEEVAANDAIVRNIKKDFCSGRFVIVWSQQGGAWAKAVVEAVGLEDFVHLTMAKPCRYYDDLPASEWMTRVIPERKT